MTNLEKIFVNLDKLTDDVLISDEQETAMQELETTLDAVCLKGDAVGRDALFSKVCDLVVTAQRDAFASGFRYAISLIFDGKATV